MDPYVEVSGRRSARWAVWSRMMIKNKSGEVYLDRLRLVQTPWFGIFLHQIVGPDPDPDPHDHPWNFFSIVLKGGYDEMLYDMYRLDRLAFTPVRRARLGPCTVWRRPRWSWHRMAAENVAHKIIAVLPNTWTLVFVGRRKRDWGFWTEDGWVYFREYEKRPDAKGIA